MAAIVLQVEGKTRIVRAKNVRTNNETDIDARYRNHEITITKNGARSSWIAIVTDESGSYAVDGIFNGTKYEVLKMCIKNILL